MGLLPLRKKWLEARSNPASCQTQPQQAGVSLRKTLMIPKIKPHRAGAIVLTITGLIIHALYSTACHKHTSETLVPADMATSMQ